MTNPIIAHVTRANTVESRHHGAFAVCDAKARIALSAGDIETAVFPRSAIKAFQCVPLIESGAAENFGLNDEEIALCCASHSGEPEHVRVAASILSKAGNSEAQFECGAHWPFEQHVLRELIRGGGQARAIHNNCSGKHAGMLALAKHMHVGAVNYVDQSHPVQKAVAAAIARLCDVNLEDAPVGIDGCSVPTWAYPLRKMALGFARLTEPASKAGAWIIRAARNHPFMIAGSGRFDTKIMEAVPRLFIKVGAEGVYCGAIAHAGLGFALKCEDGAGRAAEAGIAGVLLRLEVWTAAERAALQEFAHVTLRNWRGTKVGAVLATT